MRVLKGLASGLAAAGLAGCAAAGGAAGGTGLPQPSAARSSVIVPGPVTSTAPPAAPVSPQMRAGARAAAARFYGLYSASELSASWNLLSPATKRQVSRHLWLSVHAACPAAAEGKSRIIKAVTVFGNAAIVTEAVAGASPGTAEDVFNYVDGQWSYSPADPGIYHHGSITADIAAAKAAGFCASWKIF